MDELREKRNSLCDMLGVKRPVLVKVKYSIVYMYVCVCVCVSTFCIYVFTFEIIPNINTQDPGLNLSYDNKIAC